MNKLIGVIAITLATLSIAAVSAQARSSWGKAPATDVAFRSSWG